MRKPSFIITAIFLITLINVFITAIVGMIMKIDVFNLNDSSGMQFLILPVICGLILFCYVYFSRAIGFIAAVVLSTLFSVFLNLRIGNSFAFIIAYPVYMLLFVVTIMYIWDFINQNTIRNLSFAVVNGALYCLVFGLIQYYQDSELSAIEFTGLFKFGFVVVLLCAVSFTISEIMLYQLDTMFGWDVYTGEDDEEEEEDTYL